MSKDQTRVDQTRRRTVYSNTSLSYSVILIWWRDKFSSRSSVFFAWLGLIFLFLLPFAAPSKALSDFSIYLTSKKSNSSYTSTSPALPERPLLTIDDIVSYSPSTGLLTLSDRGRSKLRTVQRGNSFAACVDHRVIYRGKIWEGISSMISADIVFLINPSIASFNDDVHIQLGYPTAAYYKGNDDPRSDVRILRSLGNAGKLMK